MKRKIAILLIFILTLINVIPFNSYAKYEKSDYTVISPISAEFLTYSKCDAISFVGTVDHGADQVVCGLAPYNTKVTDMYKYGFLHYVPQKDKFTYLGYSSKTETKISNKTTSLFPGENTFSKTTITSSIDTANVKTGAYRFFVLIIYGNGNAMSYYYQDVEIVNPAYPADATVYIDGKKVAFQAYCVDDNNYFKLRDLAYSLSGTKKQFNVTWDEDKKAIIFTRNSPYTVVGGEMTGNGNKPITPIRNGANIYLDSRNASLFSYVIEDNNYFKLRDIAQIFDFNVTWDGVNNAIKIDTSKGYSD